MTSTVVSGSMGSQNMNLLSAAQNRDGVKTSEFKDLLSQASDEGKQPVKVNNDSKVNREVNKPQKNKSEDNTGVNEQKSTEVTKTSKTESEAKEATKEESLEVKEVVEKVEKVIEDELEVTKEEIENVLFALGLTPVALLNAENLPKVVAEIAKNDGVLSITADESLYESLNAITEKTVETVENLATELDIPFEELSKAIENNEEVKEVLPMDISDEVKIPELKADSVVLAETEVTPAVTENVISQSVSDAVKDTSFQDRISITTKPVDINEDESNEESDNSVSSYLTDGKDTTFKAATRFQTEVVSKVYKVSQNEDVANEEIIKSDISKPLNDTPMTFAENLIRKAIEVLTEDTSETVSNPYEALDVINQMTREIEVNLSPETSEINLRLHPESLGNVTVKVSANNEGVLTARFTAQNESVKAIIESQALVLKETLESKGVTVEAVEVTVQSHQFERNLSDQGKKGNSEETPRKKGIRRIDISDAAIDELTEDDALTREIMAQNGNSIDYSA